MARIMLILDILPDKQTHLVKNYRIIRMSLKQLYMLDCIADSTIYWGTRTALVTMWLSMYCR